ASEPIGSSPGRHTAIRQLELAPTIKPLCSAGIRPERTRDDLPLPDVPTTARKRVDRSRRSSSSMSFSRPKNRWSSSGSKGRRPGNGLNRAACLQLSDERPERLGCESVPLRHDNRLVGTKTLLLHASRGHETDRHDGLPL